MKKRLFIAINLPEEVKQKIKEFVGKIQPLLDDSTSLTTGGEIRFLKPETWHITITFLGYQPDDTIPAITESMKIIAQNNFDNLRIDFDKISFGPPGKRPRMIWLIGTNETSKNLALIKNKLEDELVKNGVRFEREKRGLGSAHVTLARFQATRINTDIKRIDADIISVNQRIHQRESALSFQAQSLDLMESHLKRTGAEYEICSRVDFLK